MSTRRKNKEIDSYKDRDTGIEVVIYLTPDNRFEAEYLRETYADDSVAKLKQRLWEAIKKNANLEWIPVLEIEELGSGSFNHEDPYVIGFRLDRYYIARKADDTYLRHRWLEQDEAIDPSRAQHAYFNGIKNFKVPYTLSPWGHAKTRYLPYSEEMWLGLEQLREAIGQLRERLVALLDSEEGQSHIGQVGAALLKALPAPKEE